MLNAKLIIVGGEAKTKEVKLKFPCIIGRGKGATLLLPHPLVSRQHCEIFESDGHLVVRDLGSLNGTYVNNEKIEEGHLAPGQLLTVGSVTFRAEYQNEDDSRVPPNHPTVVTTATAAFKAFAAAPPAPIVEEDEPAFETPLEPAAGDLELPAEFESASAEEGISEEVVGAEAQIEEPNANEAFVEDEEFEGLASTPLFSPESSTPSVPKATPAPMAIPVQATPPAQKLPDLEDEQDNENADDDDDDLNEFLNSLGSK